MKQNRKPKIALKGQNKNDIIMAQSLSNIYVHIIFSTKYRQKLIKPEIEDELYKYLGGICKELECYPIKIGGHIDHVHILSSLSKKITLIKYLEEIKKSSSKWIKTKGNFYKDFYWQNGYGAFSVSPPQADNIKQYIETQKEHHKNMTFQEEYIAFLNKYKIDYNEKYLWD